MFEYTLKKETIEAIGQMFIAVLNNQPMQGVFNLYQDFNAQILRQMEENKPTACPKPEAKQGE